MPLIRALLNYLELPLLIGPVATWTKRFDPSRPSAVILWHAWEFSGENYGGIWRNKGNSLEYLAGANTGERIGHFNFFHAILFSDQSKSIALSFTKYPVDIFHKDY